MGTWGGYVGALNNVTESTIKSARFVPTVSASWLGVSLLPWLTQIFGDYQRSPSEVTSLNILPCPVECQPQCYSLFIATLDAKDVQNPAFQQVAQSEDILDAQILATGSIWVQGASDAFGNALSIVTAVNGALPAANRLVTLSPTKGIEIARKVTEMLQSALEMQDGCERMMNATSSAEAGTLADFLIDTGSQTAHTGTLLTELAAELAIGESSEFASAVGDLVGFIKDAIYFLNGGFDRSIRGRARHAHVDPERPRPAHWLVPEDPLVGLLYPTTIRSGGCSISYLIKPQVGVAPWPPNPKPGPQSSFNYNNPD